ncbi:MAG: PqqD family protein [Anaerolineae bacterium]|nr:PqqD family protein [Anaerolineae bacterium]MCB9107521.1 PqqD family protein [Anaerolineales bacterium]
MVVKLLRPIRKSNIMVKDIGDETLIYSLEQEKVHVLNPTARLIWKLCDGQHSLADMEEVLRSRFVIATDHDVIDDVKQTLRIFATQGLLQQIASQ